MINYTDNERTYNFDDIYFIKLDSDFLVYSPLRQILFKANSKAVHEIKNILIGNNECNKDILSLVDSSGLLRKLTPYQNNSLFYQRKPPLTTITISITYACNLNCIYCYADGGKNNEVISEDIMRAAILLSAEESRKHNLSQLRVGFHGTGEATLHWDILVRGVELIEQIAEEFDLTPAISLLTNGTIITPDKVDFIKKHKIRISLSMDGYKEFQDNQRPMRMNRSSFEAILGGVKYLQENGIFPPIRATITNLNVAHLEEIIDFFSTNIYKGNPGKVHFEPITICGRASKNNLSNLNPDEFIKNYKKAVILGEKKNIKVSCSGDIKPGYQKVFCAANGSNFLILPNGLISSCTRVTTMDDLLSEVFIYGFYDKSKQKFILDQKKLAFLTNLDVNRNEKCRNCFCKWQCAGHCILASMSDDGYWEMMCYISRELNKWRLDNLATKGTLKAN